MEGIGERWARDPKTGKAYEVPKDMTYREWKQKYVDDSIENIEKHDIIIGKSLGAAAKNYPVRIDGSRQHVKLAENQRIEGKVFAGKGTAVAIKDRFRLESDYRVPAGEWKKLSGNGYILLKGKKQKAELHWYEARGEIYEMKAKRYIDED